MDFQLRTTFSGVSSTHCLCSGVWRRVPPLLSRVANDLAKRLLARVKQLRESLALTQEQFAERAGLGYKYYQSVEAGRRRDIRLSTLEKLAKACGLELRELLNFDPPPLLAQEDPESDRSRSTTIAQSASRSKRKPPRRARAP
jgi:transcriptional regulator with XRE-family HTH domain